MAAGEQEPTAYEILGVHASAPTELISAGYWAMASDLQRKRAIEPGAGSDSELHRLTRAYESVSDPVRRAGYNLSIAYTDESLMKRALPRRRFFLLRVFRRNRHALDWSVDAHEVLGLHPRAPQATVSIAYRLMRDTYLRLPPESRRREMLLNLLDESYALLGDPQKRPQLSGGGPAKERDITAPDRSDPPVSDPPGPTPPDAAKAKVALPSTTPPVPTESPRSPQTHPSVSTVPVAERAGQESDDDAHRSVVVTGTVAAAAGVARGVRWVIVAVAATSVVVAGSVATAVHWAALAVAALTVVACRFVARSLRSGWLAIRRWLRPSWEETQEPGARRAGDVDPQSTTPDEEFLGRLASTVEKSRAEPRRSSDETTRR